MVLNYENLPEIFSSQHLHVKLCYNSFYEYLT
jgi:hypothetical protein